MKRATNKCAWLRRSRKENCGKPCVGEYCKQHNYQLKQGGKLPTPCRVCGVGIFCDSGICISCGGATSKKRLFRQRKKEKERFERVLDELRWYTRDDSHEKPVLRDLRRRSGAVSFEISLNQGKDDITCDRTCVFLPLGSEKVNHEKGDQVERGNHADQ